MPEIKPPSRKDSTDSTRTIQPDRAGTPSLERSQRMAGESARLGKLDQRSRDLEGMRRVFPNALKDHQWEDYEQTLKALKTMDQNSEGYRKSEEILNLYDERIDTFKALKTKDPGSEGYRKSEETLNLYDRRIYMETAERDLQKVLE